MNIGMLWLKTDKSADWLTEIEAAARYYQNKYGRAPNLCFVNPAAMDKMSGQCAVAITVKPDKSILPGHLWIGVDEKAVDNEVG